MRWLEPVLVAVVLVASPAAAQDALLGRAIADVAVVSSGQPVQDALVLELVETRIGEPLDMASVRSTIDHLVTLGRYDDVRLYATAAEGERVSLRWDLRPIRRIEAVETGGRAVLDVSAIRSLVSERFGLLPVAARADDIADAVRVYYGEHGYRRARIVPTLVPRETPGLVSLRLDVDAGPRTTIGASSVVGAPNEPATRILNRLQLEPGRPFDRTALQSRLTSYEDTLRDLGHYEARVRETTVFDDDANTATVAVEVQPGPRVQLLFAGDELSSGALATLAPVREERSIDEDLLEDGSRNIAAYLRERGYRLAEAPYTRTEQDDELTVTFTVARGPLHRVGEVRVSGNDVLPTSELEPLLKLTPGEPFVDARVAVIGAAIEELYRVRGHERAAVKPVIEVLPEETDGSTTFRPVNTRFEIVEGPRTTVADVVVAGAKAIPENRLRELLALTAGRPFYRPGLSADRDTLERFYRNEGYLAATTTPSVAFANDNTSATITWTINEGAQTLVDRILISGNERTNPALIRREMQLKPGEPLGADRIAESQRRLSELGLFRRVRITDIPRTGSAARDVLVEVEEAPATAVTYGGGLEVGRRPRPAPETGVAEDRIEVAPRAFFQVDRRNLWGKNRTLSFFARVVLRPRDPPVDNTDPSDTGGYGLNEYRFTGSFREPRAFGTPGDAAVTAFLERGIRASFSFDRRGVRTDYARRFRSGLTVTGRYTNDYTELFDEKIAPEDQLLIDRLFPQVRLSTFFGAVLRDSRNDVLDPQRGAVLGLDGSLAARAIGSEVGFAKTFMQGFIYRRLPGRGFVVAAGARVGLARGFPREVPRVDEDGNPVIGPDGEQIVDVVQEVPASERFFAGGDTTVRGFALDRLGSDETLDEQGFPQGGNGLVVLNLELRAPYWKGLGLVGFVDSGNVFALASDIDVTKLRVAAGFGVRYRSPIGPLRADLGFKTNPRLLSDGSRERGAVFHLSLGQAF